MTQPPPRYAYLSNEPAPRMLLEALKLYGTQEKPGNANNPEILAWAKECGIKDYQADETPWCGLFMAVVAQRAGKPLPKTPLWARAWADWGREAQQPKLGDVLVFQRSGGGGHVGLYVAEDSDAYHVLGGNQGDAVSIKRIFKSRLIDARNHYAIAQPDNCRRIVFSEYGTQTSFNEK